MSIKLLVEAIETARVNNSNLGVAFEGKLSELVGNVIEAKTQFNMAADKVIDTAEELKVFLRSEFAARDEDMVRLMEGAA